MRAIHQLKERYPQDLTLAKWAQGVRKVYDRAQAYPGPNPRLPEMVQQAQRVKQQRGYEQELWSICQPFMGTEAPMRVLCQRVERFLPELFNLRRRAPSDGGQQRSGAQPASTSLTALRSPRYLASW